MEPGDEAARPRKAGQYAREHAQSLSLRVLFVVASLSILTAVAASTLGTHSTSFLLVEVIWIGGMAAAWKLLSPSIGRWARGAAGEEKVGRIIETMAQQGWLPIHDVNLGRGNVDHVLIGPPGLFTIETKSHRGRLHADRIPQRMLSQAYAESKRIEAIVGLPVAPLLVFSDAYLIGRVPRRQRGVIVLPARMLAGHLTRYEALYSPQEVSDLHRRLLAALQPSVT